MAIVRHSGARFAIEVPVVVIGAGACGVLAALAVREHGLEVLMLERDAMPSGSTALSSGFVPGGGTRVQQARGIDDSAARFAADIVAKARGRVDALLVRAYAEASAPALDWLAARHGLAFELVEGFLYPGHSVARLHALAERGGAALLARLHAAAADAGADLMCASRAADLVVDDMRRVCGVRVMRPDGSQEAVGCRAVVLACSGFGGDRRRVAQWLPELVAAPYFGHAGNQGDALAWGEALGAAFADMTGYQGHGSLASPHGILISWALMMKGGVQVNRDGARFGDEQTGYSEAAVAVLAQPDSVAFDVYDAHLHELGMQFPEYREAQRAGALHKAGDAPALARRLGIDPEGLAATLHAIDALAVAGGIDAFGRRFQADERLRPPYYGVRVTGALFHTQGGLCIDATTRVLDRAGQPLPNLFAAGGAARGVSGDAAWGYLSGNGLLSAVAGGYLAGGAAARLVG